MDDSAGISGYYTFPRKKFVDQSVIIGDLTSLFQITCIVNTSEMDCLQGNILAPRVDMPTESLDDKIS